MKVPSSKREIAVQLLKEISGLKVSKIGFVLSLLNFIAVICVGVMLNLSAHPNDEVVAQRIQITLAIFYVSIALGGCLLIVIMRVNYKNYAAAKAELENESLHLEQAISDLHQTQSAVEALKNLDSQKDSFLSTINHELRTPLTSIIGYLEILHEVEDERNDPKIDGYLEVLDRNAEILLDLVESILALSRLDSTDEILSNESVSLTEVIESSIDLITPAAEKKSILIDLNKTDDFLVRGDCGELSQAFTNLVGNAVKFSAHNSRVEISLYETVLEDGLRLATIDIADSGMGIPEEDIHNLFSRFYRASNAIRNQTPGSGLGLSIVDRTIHHHGGTVDIQSEINKGTTVKVRLPIFLE